jgi:hypothetical protein
LADTGFWWARTSLSFLLRWFPSLAENRAEWQVLATSVPTIGEASPPLLRAVAEAMREEASGRASDAERASRRAIELSPPCFLGWYAYGESLSARESVVEITDGQPRFVISMNEQLRAYTKALELSPPVVLPHAFTKLETLLPVQPALRLGRAQAAPERVFAAYPEISADTFAYQPRDAALVAASTEGTVPAEIAPALERSRLLLERAAAQLAARRASDSFAHLAYAKALGLRGFHLRSPSHPSAEESADRALELASTLADTLVARFERALALLRSGDLRRFREEAQTLLASDTARITPNMRLQLAGVAATLSLPARAADLAAPVANRGLMPALAEELLPTAESLYVHALLRLASGECGAQALRTLEQLAVSVRAKFPDARARRLLGILESRPALLSRTCLPPLSIVLTDTGDAMAKVFRAIEASDVSGAVKLLDGMSRERRHIPTSERALDYVLMEAVALRRLGREESADELLRQAIHGMRYSARLSFSDPVACATIARIYQLRAEYLTQIGRTSEAAELLRLVSPLRL